KTKKGQGRYVSRTSYPPVRRGLCASAAFQTCLDDTAVGAWVAGRSRAPHGGTTDISTPNNPTHKAAPRMTARRRSRRAPPAARREVRKGIVLSFRSTS